MPGRLLKTSLRTLHRNVHIVVSRTAAAVHHPAAVRVSGLSSHKLGLT